MACVIYHACVIFAIYDVACVAYHFFFCIDTNSAFLILELQNNESTVSSQFPEKSQGWRWRLLMMRI